jgi:hypothetical protein
MSTQRKETIAGWVIAAFGLMIALYGCAMELISGIAGPDWSGWSPASCSCSSAGSAAGTAGS